MQVCLTPYEYICLLRAQNRSAQTYHLLPGCRAAPVIGSMADFSRYLYIVFDPVTLW